MKTAGLALALAAACGGSLLGCGRGDRGTAVAGTLEDLAAHMEGAVVYEHGGDICRTRIGETGFTVIATNGTYPRWSPDGKQVVFVLGHQIVRVGADGRDEQIIATADRPRAVAFHPDGQAVIFTDGDTLRRVSPPGLETRTLAEGSEFREVDISPDGRKLVASVRGKLGGGVSIHAYDLDAGRNWKLAGGCSASFSPDGRRVTNLLGSHQSLVLRQWPDGKETGRVDAPPGRRFDNQFWSNHPDWLASQSEGGPADIFVHQISANRATQVTFTGDCARPDLFVYQIK